MSESAIDLPVSSMEQRNPLAVAATAERGSWKYLSARCVADDEFVDVRAQVGLSLLEPMVSGMLDEICCRVCHMQTCLMMKTAEPRD